MYKRLKWIRVGVALVVLILTTLSFTFVGRMLGNVPEVLNFQFVPALLSFLGGGAIILVFFLLLTLCFGRVYCSFICPLGILQDVISRVANLFKSKKQRRTQYAKPHNILRFTILGLIFVTLLFGVTNLLLLLDPYSNFGRIATQFFDGAMRHIQNLLSLIFPNTIFYRPLAQIVWGSFGFAALFFLVIVVMSAFKGRLYCNTICPVGSFLGLLSKISFFKLSIDESHCVGCNLCSKNCKAQCIDGKNRVIDESRCVVCLNCTTVCHGNAIKFVPRHSSAKKKSVEQPIGATSNVGSTVKGRREAIATISALGAVLVAREMKENRLTKSVKDFDSIQIDSKPVNGIIPPGGMSLKHLAESCTACHACIAACPSRIIRPAVGEYGLNNLFLPIIKYDKHYCEYNCNSCSQACPNGALKPLTIEQKRLTKIAEARFIAKNCIVFHDQTDCGACDEHCPTKAITMRPWKGKEGLTFPTLNADYCIGCGACEHACPASPKAMVIHFVPWQSEAKPPVKEKQSESVVNDFGF